MVSVINLTSEKRNEICCQYLKGHTLSDRTNSEIQSRIPAWSIEQMTSSLS